MAEYVYLSPNHLDEKFENETGISIKECIIQERLNLACTPLTTASLPVNIISPKIGCSNFAYFSRVYRQIEGRIPSGERLED